MKLNPIQFVDEVAALDIENTFNPYSNTCSKYDLDDAPRSRSKTLLAILEAAIETEIDSIWVGRDLGHRGGRRTGLALTDDVHIYEHTKRWGISTNRPTKGKPVVERTAAVIWDVLSQIEESIFLWNVFPLHPHNKDEPFSNRAHNSNERKMGQEILFQLILLLNPNKLVAIGNDAANTAKRMTGHQKKIYKLRHPSYGGQKEFYKQSIELFNLQVVSNGSLFPQ